MKEEFMDWIKNATNEQLVEFVYKTNNQSVPYLFKDEWHNFELAKNKEYGQTSRKLNELLGSAKKEDLIIFTLDDKEAQNTDIDKEKVKFIPFDKIFIQIGIPMINEDGEFSTIDGLLVLKDKDGGIWVFGINKFIRRLDGTRNLAVIKFNEEEIDLIFDFHNIEETDLYKDGTFNKTAESFQSVFGKKVLKILRFLSYKLQNNQYREYYQYKSGSIIKREIVYASEVKMHRRHFWEDSGKFIIPKLSKEEIISRGYEIDGLVFRNNELRRNVPYTIIGNFTKNKGRDKKQREINLFNKRILRQEEKIYLILKELFPNKIIRRHDRKTLNGIELDFNLPELRLAIEYDGEQHFDEELYKKLYGEGFKEQVHRDRVKDKLCIKRRIKLVRIKYDESITLKNLKKIFRGVQSEKCAI